MVWAKFRAQRVASSLLQEVSHPSAQGGVLRHSPESSVGYSIPKHVESLRSGHVLFFGHTIERKPCCRQI